MFQVKPKLSFCKICKKTCYSNSKFNQHQSKVQCGRKPYPCLLCKRSYSEKSILSTHQIIVHGPDQILNNSYYAKYSQPTLLELRNHNGSSMKHTKSLNLKNNLPICFVCNRVFSSKDDLSNHRIHSFIHKVNLLVKSLKWGKVNRVLISVHSNNIICYFLLSVYSLDTNKNIVSVCTYNLILNAYFSLHLVNKMILFNGLTNWRQIVVSSSWFNFNGII